MLSRVSPLISIQVKRMVVSREETPFETEQRDTYEMPRGENKVLVEGAPGEDEVTTEIIERNGQVVAENRVATLTLVEPVTRVVERGAKWVIASRAINVNLGNGVLGWPINGQISSRYGWRTRDFHSGLDIESPVGTPIAAADAGTVVFADHYGSYGNLVKIDHGGGLETYYAHLQAFAVDVGDKITRGQMIGTVGMTGRTSGPHVHFEVRIDGVHCDPYSYLEEQKVGVNPVLTMAELKEPVAEPAAESAEPEIVKVEPKTDITEPEAAPAEPEIDESDIE